MANYSNPWSTNPVTPPPVGDPRRPPQPPRWIDPPAPPPRRPIVGDPNPDPDHQIPDDPNAPRRPPPYDDPNKPPPLWTPTPPPTPPPGPAKRMDDRSGSNYAGNTGSHYNVAGLRQFGVTPFDSSAFGGVDPLLGPGFLDNAEGGRFGYERAMQALGGSNSFQNFMRSRMESNRSAYGADQARDPALSWTNWLLQHQNNFTNDFNRLGSSGRFPYGGADQRQPKTRWL